MSNFICKKKKTFFAKKMVGPLALGNAKAPHIFSAKNFSKLVFVCALSLDESLTYTFIKLMMFRTTECRLLRQQLFFFQTFGI